MDPAPFPFENTERQGSNEGSAFAASPAPPAADENISDMLLAFGLAEIEKQIAQEIATAIESHGKNETTEGTSFAIPETETRASQSQLPESAAQERSAGMIDLPEGRAERDAMEEVQAGAPAETAEALCECEPAAPDALTFFGMPQQAFDVTPDPAYLYLSPSHREALASLNQGIEHFRGFVVLIAEPGMGKTTLLHRLMEEVSDSARVVFLFQTQCSSRELLCFILNELEVDHAGMDVVGMHRALNQALLEEMLRGRRFVLVVDEAQNLQEPVLETIRLLSDFETTHSKLIQIVLAGQPQLADTLMRPGLVQLRQRIAVLSSLKSLSAAETADYVEHRLRASGWTGVSMFTREALAQIAESSQGVPRTINNLCFNALLTAFRRQLDVIDADIVNEVAGKLDVRALLRGPQKIAGRDDSAYAAIANSDSQLARDPGATVTLRPGPGGNSGATIDHRSSPETVLTGTLTEKVRSQGWSKRHEYRIMVTLERDRAAGVPIADRYYCCSMYVDESQAVGLKVGQPVRIRIEQGRVQ